MSYVTSSVETKDLHKTTPISQELQINTLIKLLLKIYALYYTDVQNIKKND